MKQNWRGVTGGTVLALVALGAWGAWAGAGSAAAAEAAGQKDAAVAVQLFQFKPSPLEVKVGARVTWTNSDDIVHTVTSGAPENRDGRFDGRLSGVGTTYSVEFTQPGTYSYFCARHQSMRGEIRINP